MVKILAPDPMGIRREGNSWRPGGFWPRLEIDFEEIESISAYASNQNSSQAESVGASNEAVVQGSEHVL